MLELLNQLDGFDSRGDVKVCDIPANSAGWVFFAGLVGRPLALTSHNLGLFYRTPRTFPGDHGYQPTGHAGPGAAPPRSPRQKDRDPAAERAEQAGHASLQFSFTIEKQS